MSSTYVRSMFSGWQLFQVPRRAIGYLLAVDAVALLIVLISTLNVTVTTGEIVTASVLAGCGVAHTELASGIEKARRAAAGQGHVDLASVWVFAGVLLLPTPLMAAVIAVVYAHYQWRNPFVGWHRRVFGIGVMIIAGAAAARLLDLVGGPGHLFGATVAPLTVLVVVAALLTFSALDVAMIAARVLLYGTPGVTVRKGFSDPSKHMLEISTLFYGALLAFALSYSPALVVLALPPVLMLHRAVLLKQVEEKASKDAKTGLFNSEGWHNRASRERSRAMRANDGFGLLMVDLDHFKKVNDTYGHVAGDAVLKAVADAISGEVRDYDSVGRFGGEEFVVLLPGMSEDDGVGVAERIRHAVTQLAVEAPVEGRTTIIRNLSASIGVSTFPNAGDDIEPLLLAADAALYQAKNSGRNRVVSCTALAKPVLAVAA